MVIITERGVLRKWIVVSRVCEELSEKNRIKFQLNGENQMKEKKEYSLDTSTKYNATNTPRDT